MSTVTVAGAARNNAQWCDTMCRAHGSAGEFHADAWTTSARSPQYYPDAVTLAPDADIDRVLSRIDARAGCSIKDSFATLNLSEHGFRVLFDAEWIIRPPTLAGVEPDLVRWEQVVDARELASWERAWSGSAEPAGVFRPEVLRAPNVAVLAGRVAGRIRAGAVLNHDSFVVGLSNLFTNDGDLDAAWTAAISAACARFPNETIVGYQSGDDLAVARRHGFTPLGPLLVWVAER